MPVYYVSPLMCLVPITRHHTRKISASAEVGRDKDGRRDITVGHQGGTQRRRRRKKEIKESHEDGGEDRGGTEWC